MPTLRRNVHVNVYTDTESHLHLIFYYIYIFAVIPIGVITQGYSKHRKNMAIFLM